MIPSKKKLCKNVHIQPAVSIKLLIQCLREVCVCARVKDKMTITPSTSCREYFKTNPEQEVERKQQVLDTLMPAS